MTVPLYSCPQNIATEVETLIKHNMGLHEVATFNSTKVQLQRYLQDFIFAHDVVMVQYPPVSPVHIAWNQEQTFDVHYLLYGEPMVRQSTQIAFTSEFVSNVQVVLNLSVEDCTMSNRFVYYVIENHDGLHDVYEQSMRLRFSKFNSDYSSFSGMVRGALSTSFFWRFGARAGSAH